MPKLSPERVEAVRLILMTARNSDGRNTGIEDVELEACIAQISYSQRNEDAVQANSLAYAALGNLTLLVGNSNIHGPSVRLVLCACALQLLSVEFAR